MLKPGPMAQVQVQSSFRALKARNDRDPTLMANHFGARVAISRFQRLKTHRRSHPGRCPGLLHFAPLALGFQVLTQTLNRWAIFSRPLTRTGALSTFCAKAPFRVIPCDFVDRLLFRCVSLHTEVLLDRYALSAYASFSQ